MKTFVLLFSIIIFCINTLSAQYLWGVTNSGGRFGLGTVFKINKETKDYTVLHDFDLIEGGCSFAPLYEAADGNFYGTTTKGGQYGLGSIFRISPKGEFKVLWHFNLVDGDNAFGGLTEGSKGILYGMTTDGGKNGLGTIFRIAPDGSNFEVIWHFNFAEGARPQGALLRGDDGAFYGMTSEGGEYGMGTMFRMTGDGKDFSVFHHFLWSDGAYPYGSILQNCDGVLYGVTHCGGNHGVGVVFSIERSGKNFKVLHHFDNKQGGHPYSDLIEGCDGVLYGTTNTGGQYDSGTVFSIGTDGKKYKVLYDLNYAMEGANPESGLLEDNGTLYGTTSYGGKYWGGTAFSLGVNGDNFNILLQFNPEEGGQPHATLTALRPKAEHPNKLEQKNQPKEANDK